jgi:hypothetical protein
VGEVKLREPEHLPLTSSKALSWNAAEARQAPAPAPAAGRKQMKRPLRMAAAALAPVLTLGFLATATPTAQAEPSSPQAQAASQWLAGQLTNGLIHNDSYGGFDDYGLSVDTGFALIATGTQTTAVGELTTALADNIGAYVGDGTTELWSGSTGKAAVFASAAGADPANFGGKDLIAQLESSVATTAPIDGRIEDTSPYGDYANVLGQAWAVEALDKAASPKVGAATDFLLQQQCSEGYFRTYLNADKTAADQSCEGGKAANESNPSTDATALAVITLSNHAPSPAVDDAVAKAKSWLQANQKADGSWAAGDGIATANSNSTGIATWALSGTTNATRGAAWLSARQVGAGEPNLTAEVGAIAYDDAALSTAKTSGINDDTARDQWRRATAQATLGLNAITPALPSPDADKGPKVALKKAVVKPKKRIVVRSTAFKSKEKVVVRYKGKVVKRGKATKKGVFVSRFKAGKKPGTYKIAVIGKKTGKTVVTIQVKR